MSPRGDARHSKATHPRYERAIRSRSHYTYADTAASQRTDINPFAAIEISKEPDDVDCSLKIIPSAAKLNEKNVAFEKVNDLKSHSMTPEMSLSLFYEPHK